MRAMAIWLPTLSIDVRRRRDRRAAAAADAVGADAVAGGEGREPAALLMVASVGQRRVVRACCALAVRAGVREGMSLAQAQVVLGSSGGSSGDPSGAVRGRCGVDVVEHEPRRDARALRSLALWCERFSPAVMIDPPDGLLMDVRGVGVLMGGEARLLDAVLLELGRLGFAARGAIAPSYAGARAVCRHAAPRRDGGAWIIDTREALAEAVHGLSVASLGGVPMVDSGRPVPEQGVGLAASLVGALAEVGVRTVAELARLPRASVARRFGHDLVHRLDRVMGLMPEVMRPERRTAPMVVERLLDGPTTRIEVIEMVCRELLGRLEGELTRAQRGVRLLEVTLSRADLPAARLDLTLSRAWRDAGHLWRLLRPRLERVHLGYGVEGVMMAAAWTARLRHEQEGIAFAGAGAGAGAGAERGRDAHSPADEGAFARAESELIDTLSNRLTPARVTVARLTGTHQPERAVLHEPALHAMKRAGGDAPGVRVGMDIRPTSLAERAAEVRVVCMTPDGPVVAVGPVGAGARGGGAGMAEVIACVGPERIESEWWRAGDAGGAVGGAVGGAGSGSASRDFFRICTRGGQWLWLSRTMPGNIWRVEGVW